MPIAQELKKVQSQTAAAKQTHTTIRELSSVVDQQMMEPQAEAAPAALIPAAQAPVVSAEPAAPALDQATESPPAAESKHVFPVDPSRVSADGPSPAPGLSDLSVFRDIFSPTKPWH